nr:MAG: hypothetical protein [Microviridae sp.]
MAFRKRFGKRQSRKNFSGHSRHHKKNMRANPMRGGFRI